MLLHATFVRQGWRMELKGFTTQIGSISFAIYPPGKRPPICGHITKYNSLRATNDIFRLFPAEVQKTLLGCLRHAAKSWGILI